MYVDRDGSNNITAVYTTAQRPGQEVLADLDAAITAFLANAQSPVNARIATLKTRLDAMIASGTLPQAVKDFAAALKAMY